MNGWRGSYRHAVEWNATGDWCSWALERRSSGNVVARISGELDAHAATLATRAWWPDIARADGSVVVDLSRVTFADGLGVTVLADLGAAVREQGRRFALRRPHGSVLAVLACLRGIADLEIEWALASGAILVDDDAIELSTVVLDEALTRVGGDKGTVRLVDPLSGGLGVVAHEGCSRALLTYADLMYADEHDFIRSMRAGRCVEVDVAEGRDLDGPIRDALQDDGSRTFLATPLTWTADGVQGWITVHRGAAGRWSSHDHRVLADLGRSASRALVAS